MSPDKKDIEAVVEKSGSLWPLVWKASVGLLVGAVTWAGSSVMREYDRIRDSNAAMEKRIEELEQDKAKWATLAALEQKQLEMRIQLEVMRQVWEFQYQREVPTGFPKRIGEPVLRPPDELFRDIDRYKAMQQQKMPNMPVPKK